jgi:hypothetical protein
MKLEEIRNIAKQIGLKPGKLTKGYLIKSIQIAEGHFDCFGSAFNQECNQIQCLWRDDCFDASQKQGT